MSIARSSRPAAVNRLHRPVTGHGTLALDLAHGRLNAVTSGPSRASSHHPALGLQRPPPVGGRHLITRKYARIVAGWITLIGLDPHDYGTHSLRRTKATLIYRRTTNLRAIQLLLEHTKLESTVRYLGVEVDDALEMAEQTEV